MLWALPVSIPTGVRNGEVKRSTCQPPVVNKPGLQEGQWLLQGNQSHPVLVNYNLITSTSSSNRKKTITSFVTWDNTSSSVKCQEAFS